jgi:protein involved in polysaccharide export with SLBB domain
MPEKTAFASRNVRSFRYERLSMVLILAPRRPLLRPPRRIVLPSVAFAGLLAAGCSPISRTEFDSLQRIQSALSEARKDYVVQPGDTVNVTVYRGVNVAPEYKQEITVQPDGKITLINILKPVDTKGLSVDQLQRVLTDIYAPLFVMEGEVLDRSKFSVTVQFLTSQKTAWLPDQIFVTGQVRAPKSMAYRTGLTVMKAVTDAGGWIYAADETEVVILRKNAEGTTVAREIDLAAVALNQAEDIELSPGDVVFVPLSTIARINLWVEYYIRGLIPINPSVIRSFVFL